MRSIKHDKPARTVGGQTARLLNTLHDRSQSIFTRAEAAKITGISLDSASSLLHKAMKRGLVSRLKPGLFTIVPAELGSATEYMGDSYKVGQRLAGSAPSFISHASAMEIHRMVTQPQLVVYVSCTKRVVNRSLHGADFRFVLIKNDHFFGTAKHWVSKQESVDVSDPERTIIDGLRQPEYCGGLTEVAKALWMRRQDMEVSKLVDYALRLNIGAVVRRLGYLLESYRIASNSELARLQKPLTATYARLDPTLASEGTHLKRWRLQLNVSPEELDAVRAA